MSGQPQPQQEPQQQPGRRPAPGRASDFARSLKTAAYVVVAVVTTIFLLRNSQSVDVDFVVTSVSVPLFLVLLITLILGAVLALGAQGLRSRRRGKRAQAGRAQLPPGQHRPGRAQ